MKKIKFILGIFLVLFLFLNFSQAKMPVKDIDKTKNVPVLPEPDKTKVPSKVETTAPKPANYNLVTDVLDAFEGKKSSGGCNISFFAGGQSSPIGPSSSTNYLLYAGFIYPLGVNCGDANLDGVIDIGDIVYLITYVFYNGPAPVPIELGDVNCDEVVDIGDIVYLITYVFYGGPTPVCL